MTTRDLVLISLFSAIIIALGLLPPITIGFIPVPITAQSLGVMLAGVVLGAKRGTLAVLLTILIAAIGLPVLSGGRGGLSIFTTPTTGFLIGWIAAAFRHRFPLGKIRPSWPVGFGTGHRFLHRQPDRRRGGALCFRHLLSGCRRGARF